MNFNRNSLLLYGITDRRWLSGKTLASQVEEAILGGVTFIQFREKELHGKDLEDEAVRIRDVCRKYKIPFVLDDNVELAKKIDADGVHVGQSDMEAGKAREILGPGKIIGVSAHSVNEAIEAEKNGADYLGVGAAFATGSKSDARPVERHTYRDIAGSVKIPIIAIGGITKENVRELGDTGIAGVAVISGIFAAADVRKAAAALKASVSEITGESREKLLR